MVRGRYGAPSCKAFVFSELPLIETRGYLGNVQVTKVTFTPLYLRLRVAIVRQFWGRTAERSAPRPRGFGAFFYVSRYARNRSAFTIHLAPSRPLGKRLGGLRASPLTREILGHFAAKPRKGLDPGEISEASRRAARRANGLTAC